MYLLFKKYNMSIEVLLTVIVVAIVTVVLIIVAYAIVITERLMTRWFKNNRIRRRYR